MRTGAGRCNPPETVSIRAAGLLCARSGFNRDQASLESDGDVKGYLGERSEEIITLRHLLVILSRQDEGSHQYSLITKVSLSSDRRLWEIPHRLRGSG